MSNQMPSPHIKAPPLDEATPESANFTNTKSIVHAYLGDDWDTGRHTLDNCRSFTLWGRNAERAFHAQEIAIHAVNGDRTQAFMLANQYPESLKCLTRARGPNNIEVDGLTPFQISISCGDSILSQALIKSGLLTPDEMKTQLNMLFPNGWEKRLNDRMERESLVYFRKYVNDLMNAAESAFERLTRDYRAAVLKQLTEPVNEGLMIDATMVEAAIQIILNKRARMGGWGSHKVDLAFKGLQFLLGIRANAFMAQIIVSNMNDYFDIKIAPYERLNFSDRTPFFSRDPLVGVGRSFVFDYTGQKCNRRERCRCGSAHDGSWAEGVRFGNLMSSKNINIDALLQPQENPLRRRLW